MRFDFVADQHTKVKTFLKAQGVSKGLLAKIKYTGGSILVIGSTAGVAFMGLEKVDFFWYFKRVGIPATVGYFAGIGVYQLIN